MLYNDFFFSDDVSRRLLRLVDAMQRTQLQEEHAQRHGSGSATLFRITSLELDLRDVEMHDHILQALHRICQLGVRVDLLRLPSVGRELPTMDQWGLFVRLITGIDTDEQGRLASVRRLVVPACYASTFHFAPLCSAYAHGVDDVIIIGSQDREKNHDAFGSHVDARHHVWRWLSFAFFSEASTTSVKSLTIDGERLCASDVAILKRVTGSSDPVLLLSQYVLGGGVQPPGAVTPTSENTRPHISIRRRSLFRAVDGRRTSECQHPTELTGELLPGLSAHHQGLVFIPGYASFCKPQSHSCEPPPEKRAKRDPLQSVSSVSSSSCFQSLVLRHDDGFSMTTTTKTLHDVLEVIGSRLRGLKLDFESDEATLRSVFALCPNLESLAISRMALSSMEIFEEAYTKDIKLSSLSFDRMDVPEQEAIDFLHKLTERDPREGSMADMLERLDWGSHWPERTLPGPLKLFKDILHRNTTLTHVVGRIFRSVPSFTPSEELGNVYELHGTRFPGHSRSQKKQLMAFLCSMRAITKVNPVLSMDPVLTQRIWEFAATPRYRAVSWSYDFDQDEDEDED